MPSVITDPGQYRFDPLDFQDRMGLDAKAARREALSARAVFVKACHANGMATKCFTLTGQLRPYAAFGVSDGRIRNVYYVNVAEKCA